ncbi:HET-domain-containing protein [Lindgomyces ingoldianus]|uniref:HET-domain-containing protein n=1 Tax=Lindgomyces ingoldianus TaxID=673940 RepID=A0ACB6QV98_9PLEO|nr:HET-domain-containing protein [Lindgomyces ingoldianus]KAF2470498.1 HET-domain-containing protein [Lindgomyces ingoldianus]
MLFSDVEYQTGHEQQKRNAEQRPKDYVRVIGKAANITLLRSWVETCEKDHSEKCNSSSLMPGRGIGVNIRFIDVHKDCIVPGTLGHRYFALSYVWGAAKQFKLEISNSHALQQPGSLSQVLLPQTIRDSMSLVSSLEERYLWVDALCIVQDDDQGKAVQIEQMASIYVSALATIVALSGTSASSGLPGIPPSPRNPHSIQIAPTLRLAPRTSFSEIFNSSVYSSRAWTFQERILSPRCLFFTAEQVHFQCLSASYCEDRSFDCIEDRVSGINPLSEAQIWSRNPRSVIELDGNNGFRFYARFIADYSTKNMGYLSDAINAIAAILGALEGLYGWRYWNGLPNSLIDLALLWTPKQHVIRREFGGKTLFPSGSWAGWVGAVHYGDLVQVPPQIPLCKAFRSCVAAFHVLDQTGCHSFASDSFRIARYSTQLVNEANHCQVTTEVSFLFDAQSRRCGIAYGIIDSLAGVDLILLSTFSRTSSLETHGPIITTLNMEYMAINERLFHGDFSDEAWCTLNVLLVEWKSGYARRVGIGQVCREAWDSCRIVKKDILLA